MLQSSNPNDFENNYGSSVSVREQLIIALFRQMGELERMAVRLFIDTDDDTWLREFNNERMSLFVKLLDHKDDSPLSA